MPQQINAIRLCEWVWASVSRPIDSILDNERKGPQTDNIWHCYAQSQFRGAERSHIITITIQILSNCNLYSWNAAQKVHRDMRCLISRRSTTDRNATHGILIKKTGTSINRDLLMRMSFPWHSISKWWFMTSDGCTKPPRWLCNGSWCASGPLMSVMAIFGIFCLLFFYWNLLFSVILIKVWHGSRLKKKLHSTRDEFR